MINENDFVHDVENGLSIKELSIKYLCGTTTVSRLKKKLNCYSDISSRGNSEVFCKTCGVGFLVNNWRLKSQDDFFCSKSCSVSSSNKNRIGEKHPLWAGENTLHYRTNAIRRYGEVCSICGYNKKECLHVHHIDQDRKNGNIYNLIVLCPNCHAEVHAGITELPD